MVASALEMPELPEESSFIGSVPAPCELVNISLFTHAVLDEHNLPYQMTEGYLPGKVGSHKPFHFITIIIHDVEDPDADFEFYLNLPSGVEKYTSMEALFEVYPKGVCSLVERGKTKI